jgi:DNA-binding CsgD family transcriptional regulator
MSVRFVWTPGERARAIPAAWGVHAGMSYAAAAAVLAISAGVVTLLVVAHPKDALGYLLAIPVWIVAKDLGVLAGAFAAACALAFVVIFGTAIGPLGSLGCGALLFGAVAAGARATPRSARDGEKRWSPRLPLLTERPAIVSRADGLSRRELQVLEMIATGAKNAQIAERFVISENTVKSHVSRILQKLPAKNRTEAAFRYLELYGAPAIPEEQSATADGPSQRTNRITAAGAVRATVSAPPRGDGLMLTLEDGRDLDVPILDEIRGHVALGAPAIVYFDQQDRLVGWYLPDEEIGVDLRDWAP